MKISIFKSLFLAVKSTEVIVNNWSNEENNVADLTILPPEKKYGMTVYTMV